MCDSVKGDVESYHPSYAWAMERIEREMDAGPLGVKSLITRRAVRLVRPTPGELAQFAHEADVA